MDVPVITNLDTIIGEVLRLGDELLAISALRPDLRELSYLRQALNDTLFCLEDLRNVYHTRTRIREPAAGKRHRRARER